MCVKIPYSLLVRCHETVIIRENSTFAENQPLLEFSPIMTISFQRTNREWGIFTHITS